MDPKSARKAIRDGMWVMAGAFILFPLISAVALGFNSGDVGLILVGIMFVFVGIFAGRTGIA